MKDSNKLLHENWPSNQAPRSDNNQQQREWREKFSTSDREAGIEVTDSFKPFNQINDMFARAFWDDSVRSKKTDAFFRGYRVAANPRPVKGFQQRDLALRNAAWTVSNMISERKSDEGKREGFQSLIEEGGPVAAEKIEIDDVQAHTDEMKKIARFFGADLFGVTELDTRWHYSKRVDTRDFSTVDNILPDAVNSVIVMGHAMNHDLVATYPSALAGAATGIEYSHEAAIVVQLVTYIRNLGFNAIGSMNDTALVIPYAVKAGLGEYGRNQMVITPEFGPRVRFSKIFTDMPLLHSRPDQRGVREFCDICTKCADACPPKALPYGPPTAEPQNSSTIKGVKKWSADCEKCFGYWAAIGTDCAICMRVCPFNRTYDNWRDKLFLKLAYSRFRRLALWWDNKTDRAKRVKPQQWWRQGV
jgi:epoxyqueuosine reductase